MEQQEPATNPEAVEPTPAEKPGAAPPPDQPSASAPELAAAPPSDQSAASAPELAAAPPSDQPAASTPAVDHPPPVSPQTREADIAQTIARSVREVPGVADIYAGRSIIPAVIKRSRNVPGVQVLTEAGRLKIEVQVVATYTPDLSMPAVAAAIRRNIRQHLTTSGINNLDTIDVVFADIVDPAPTAKEAHA